MKKILNLLGLAFLSGALVLGGVSKHKEAQEADASYESYIPVNRELFEVWDDNAGTFGDQNSTFWDQNFSFQAMGPFFRGESNEGWTGTLRTRSWKQHTQYIYFQLGGANNNVDYTPVHLKIYYGNEGWFQLFYNDTFVENEMLMRSFKIPDNSYNALKAKGDDFDMYIEIVDTQKSSFGFANFGYLNVNQTEDSTADALRWYINHLNRDSREYSINKRKQILENYYLNGSLKELFLKPHEDISENFDNNQDFVNHWYFDYHYAQNMNWDFHVDRAIGTDTYRPEASTNMPFNNTNGFFRGWFENDDLGGFVGGDASFYRFLSRPFVLKGTGLVSIKMAGTASLHVIDAETRQDLVWANLLSYGVAGDQVNLATSGFNTVTMVRHVINLEAYLGRNIQLAIADVSSDGWSALYVDELVTNYESYPAFKVDTFTQTNNSGTFNAYRIDKYINSSLFNEQSNPTGLRMVLESSVNQENDNAILNHVDNSIAKEAYEFLEGYYSSLRSPSNKFDYFEASNEARDAVVTAYKNLSEDAKTIVDKSVDIVYPGTFVEEWWTNKVVTSSTIGENISQLMVATVHTVSFVANGGEGTMTSVTKEEGATYSLPECGFIASEGYRFIGWTIGEDSTLRQPNYEITINSDVTLTAHWEEIPVVYHTISFASNGGSGLMESEVLKEGTTYQLPENKFTAPSGYQFVGWKVGNDPALRQPGNEFIVTADVVVTAQWELIPVPTYTVSFNSNGGYGTMDSIIKEEGSTYVLPQCKFKAPDGYEFEGWIVGSDETIRQPGYEITVTGDVVVTAQWKLLPIPEYVVSFDANGGSGSMTSVTIKSGEQFTLPECSFVAPEGYVFDYWLISSVKYQPGDKVTVVGDTVIKASWKNAEPVEPQEEDPKEEQESKSFFNKVLEAIQNFFNKIVEFFKNLFSKTSN